MLHRIATILFVVLIPITANAELDYLYLTWQGDTSTTMTVHYHTPAAAESMVEYAPAPAAETPQLIHKATGTSRQIPGLADARYIHTVQLTDLAPGTVYAFKTAHGKTGRFRTLPNDGSPIRGIFGGDIGIFPLVIPIIKHAAAQTPDLAVIGGDLAYENGELKNVLAWNIWLSRWEEHMVRPDGLIIPVVLAIGNHEVNKLESTDPLVRAPFYFHFFEQGGKSYFTRNLGPHATLIALDSGHITPWEEQVPFLKDSLQDAEAKPFIFATYHVPQYPSHRSFDDERSAAARKHWQPLFDEYDLSIGFENHDHTFKRSKPIRNNEVNPEGTTYLGDGSMGVGVRPVDQKDAWYIEKAESKAHFWVVDITKEKIDCRAIDHLGQEFDQVSFTPRAVPALP